VAATQNQYSVLGSIGLVRLVPTVSWLNSRNRTSTDFSWSFGKITQPGYTYGGVYTPAVVTKSAIYHADAERDEYLSPRFFVLGQTAFDHNRLSFSVGTTDSYLNDPPVSLPPTMRNSFQFTMGLTYAIKSNY
jgi:hypothetical protein